MMSLLPELKNKGFNIFFTSPVKDFSPELLSFFTAEEKKKSLILLGSGGKTLWDKIPDKTCPHPFDSYSKETMQWLIEEAKLKNADILFPFSDRILPLQKIGRHFSFAAQSPIGPDISHEFGLWFAYRGVILTDTTLESSQKIPAPFACESCISKPCLSTTDLYSARLLCPFKPEHQYLKEQLDYHLDVLRTLNV